MSDQIDSVLFENISHAVALFNADGNMTRTNRHWEMVCEQQSEDGIILTYDDLAKRLNLPEFKKPQLQDFIRAVQGDRVFMVVRHHITIEGEDCIMVEVDEITNIEKNINHTQRIIADSMWKIRSKAASVQNVFSLFIDYLSETFDGDSLELLVNSQREMWELSRQVENLRYLTILDSAADTLKPVPVAVNVRILVENIIDDMKPLISSVVPPPEVILEIDASRKIVTDRIFFQKVFSSLLCNTIYYNDNPVKVTISGREDSEGYRLMVNDNGWGVPIDEQPSIFNYAFRGKRSQLSAYSGLGVELYIARKLAGLLHSDLQFISKENEGTEFSIIFLEQP